MKNLSLILVILFLSGCQTIEKYSQCDGDKNYVHVNNLLLDEYNLQNKNKMIKNYYILNDNSSFCSNELCFKNYDLDFIEYKFVNFKLKSGKILNGYYQLSTKESINDNNCYYKSNDKNCYIIKEIREPTSQYKLHIYTENNIYHQKFIDTKINKKIIDISYQVYSISNPLSGIGGAGICENNFQGNKNSFSIPNIKVK